MVRRVSEKIKKENNNNWWIMFVRYIGWQHKPSTGATNIKKNQNNYTMWDLNT